MVEKPIYISQISRAYQQGYLTETETPDQSSVMTGTGNFTFNFTLPNMGIADTDPKHLYGIISVIGMGLAALVLSAVFICYTRSALYAENNHVTMDETELMVYHGEAIHRTRCASESDVKMKFIKVDKHRPMSV